MLYNITGLAVYDRPIIDRLKGAFKRAFSSLFLKDVLIRPLFKSFLSYSLRVVSVLGLRQSKYLSSSEYLNKVAFLSDFHFQQSVRQHNVKMIRGF